MQLSYMAIPGLKFKIMGLQNTEYAVVTVIELVCFAKGVAYETMKTGSRKRDIAYARQLCMYLLKERTKLTFKRIGELFGSRDHTTVMHAQGLIRDLMASDPAIKDEVDSLKRRL